MSEQQTLFSFPEYAAAPVPTGPRRGLLVIGPNASGKTTAVERGTRNQEGIYVVHGDTAMNKGTLRQIEDQLALIWGGPWERVVVESTNRVALCVLRVIEADPTARACDVFVTSMALDVAREAIRARCARRGKQFRADYWDEGRLRYEGSGRYKNLAERFAPHARRVVAWEIGAHYDGHDGLVAGVRAWCEEGR